MDNNVPPYNTLLVVNELIKANKDFDLIMFPNRRAWLWRRIELHDPAPLGLLRPLPLQHRAADELSTVCAGGRGQGSARGELGANAVSLFLPDADRIYP